MAMRACGEFITRKVSKQIDKKVKCVDSNDVSFIMKKEPITIVGLTARHKKIRNEKNRIKKSKLLSLNSTLKQPILLANDGYDLHVLYYLVVGCIILFLFFCFLFRDSLWSSFNMIIRGEYQIINNIPVRFTDITVAIDCFKYLCSKSCTQDAFDTNVACCLTKGSTTFIWKRM